MEICTACNGGGVTEYRGFFRVFSVICPCCIPSPFIEKPETRETIRNRAGLVRVEASSMAEWKVLVLDAIANGHRTKSQIAEITGLNHRMVSKALRSLSRSGHITTPMPQGKQWYLVDV